MNDQRTPSDAASSPRNSRAEANHVRDKQDAGGGAPLVGGGQGRDGEDLADGAWIIARIAMGLAALALVGLVACVGGWGAATLAVCLAGFVGPWCWFDGQFAGESSGRKAERNRIRDRVNAIGGRVRT